MDKELSNIAENLGYSLKTDEDANFLINMLKNKLQHYKKLNGQNEQIISQLKVNPDSLNSHCKDILLSFAKLQEESGANSLEFSDVGVAFLDVVESKNKNKIKSDTLKVYQTELSGSIDEIRKEIEKLEKEISIASSRIDDINCLSNIEVNSMKMLTKSYEEKILQYIDKHPWLTEPEYNSLSIQEEIKKLHKLRSEVEKLQNDKNIYQGLKPDLYAAKNQLAQVKIEYETMYKTYHDSLK